MPIRKAACDPCRVQKLACDHARPVCTRCQKASRGDRCTYRSLPFKRKRHTASTSDISPRLAPAPTQSICSLATSPAHRVSGPSPDDVPYPNPGFLGSLSSVAIFSHVSPQGREAGLEAHDFSPRTGELDISDERTAGQTSAIAKGATLVKDFVNQYQASAFGELIAFWRAKWSNLHLAGPFVDDCVASIVQHLVAPRNADWHSTLAEDLFRTSRQPFQLDESSELPVYVAQFTGNQCRWETMGIFLAAVAAATNTIDFFPPLYRTEEERYRLRRMAANLCDVVLEICLSLDRLNDLQLVLQYENWVLHSYVDGDQSYNSWRLLGDAIASLLALGYHQRVPQNTPSFLAELRTSTFARLYGADKNVAIFLGRPPRLCKRFCYFQYPRSVLDSEAGIEDHSKDDENNDVSFAADSSWAARCALLKEDALELLSDQGRVNCWDRASTLQLHAEELWQEMPGRWRLEGSLKENGLNPFQRDFMLSARLNYLHVLFLIHFVQLHSLGDPDVPIIAVADEMLKLVTEATLQRDRLANSGVGFVWKVIYYGLPAAGILLLAILKRRRTRVPGAFSLHRAAQNLRLLVSQVQLGSLSSTREPNFALLSKAARTMEDFLDVEESRPDPTAEPRTSEEYQSLPAWELPPNLDPFNFDTGFWDAFMEQTASLGQNVPAM